MPKHRNLVLDKFLRSVPEGLVEEYFLQKLNGDRPCSSYDCDTVSTFLKEFKSESIRNSILEDFHYINDICDSRMYLLIRAMGRYNVPVIEEASKEELAMMLFLRHKAAFGYAYDHYCLHAASKKMCQYRMLQDGFSLSPERIEAFRGRVSDFYLSSAKGRQCIVHYHDEEEEAIIIVMRGSYKKSVPTWQEEEIKTLFYRPAAEDIIQYNKKTGALSIKAPYPKDRTNYLAALSTAILEDENQAELIQRNPTYTLEPLRDGTFSFAGNELIKSITLVEIKLAMRGWTHPKVTVNSGDVRETLERDLYGIRMDSGDLIHAKFRFQLEVEGKVRNVTFEIEPPNATDLCRKAYADIIGDYLKLNGVKLV